MSDDTKAWILFALIMWGLSFVVHPSGACQADRFSIDCDDGIRDGAM